MLKDFNKVDKVDKVDFFRSFLYSLLFFLSILFFDEIETWDIRGV